MARAKENVLKENIESGTSNATSTVTASMREGGLAQQITSEATAAFEKVEGMAKDATTKTKETAEGLGFVASG